MLSSVRESASACQAGCPRTDSRLSVLPQVSAIGHVLSSQDVAVIVIVALALVAAVVLTAIWSRDKDRRKDARAVLKLLLRRHP